MSGTKNLTGQRFGKWTVVAYAGKNKHGHLTWHCVCDCGTERVVFAQSLRSGASVCCGCDRFENLTGQRFTNWLVDMRGSNDRHGQTMWHCICDCGTRGLIRGKALTTGISKSCGCIPKHNKLPAGEAGINSAFYSHQQNAKIRGIESFLTREQFVDISTKDCTYCGQPPSLVTKSKTENSDFIRSSIDRKNNEKYYKLKNSVPCCNECNIAKGDKPYAEWIAMLNRLDRAVIRRSGNV